MSKLSRYGGLRQNFGLDEVVDNVNIDRLLLQEVEVRRSSLF
jgi:hypothetical protein